MPLGSRKYYDGRRSKEDMRPLQRVPGQGPIPCDIMLIGERPTESEAKAGYAFVGYSAITLNMLLADAGLERSQVYTTTVIKEWKEEKDRVPQHEAQRDWPCLHDEICHVRPKIVGLMGTFAVEKLMSVERAHLERNHSIPTRSPFRGQNIFIDDIIWLPMFHPSAGAYNQNHMAMCMEDFERLGQLARGEYRARTDEFAGIEEYRSLTPDQTGGTVRADSAIDTEGSKRYPWCLTYSVRPGASWLERPNPRPTQFEGKVWLHNSLHDLGVLRKMGVSLADGQFVDTMVLAYLLCTEPQGLKDQAFRNAGMLMSSYDEILGEASRDKALEYLVGVDANEWSPSQEYVIIKAGKAKVCKPHSINQRVRRILADVDADKRDKYGNQVDPRGRWNDIEDHLKQDVVEALGPMPEATLDDVPAAKAERYACRDSDATLRIAPVLEEKIARLGLSRVSSIDHSIIPMIDRMQHTGMGLAPVQFWDDLEAECDAIMAKAVYDIYKASNCTINPDSPKQTAELLFDVLDLKATKFTDKGARSTKDKVLEAMFRDHAVVDMVLVYREASKIKSSYCRPLRSIVRGGENRVHPNLRITRVSSGRLAANEPNLLAIPVRSELGKKVRGGFVAGEGRVLMDEDLDQIEMRWMADASRDAGLVRLFIEGKKDVHTETASGMFSVGYENVLPEQRYAAKRVGFGVITGITEHGLLDQMALARAVRPDGKPWTLDDCTIMIREYFKIRPAVRIFMDTAGDEAEAQGWVADHWGRRRYLPGARSPVPSVKAESRRQASSHKIQAGAQGLMKLAMSAIWNNIIKPFGEGNWDNIWPVEPLLQIHDSLLFDVSEDYTWVEPMIIECLTKTTLAPNTGLPFKAKGGKGKAWNQIK